MRPGIVLIIFILKINARQLAIETTDSVLRLLLTSVLKVL